MLQDLRYALRTIAARPAAAVLVVGLLATGMSAGTLAFCLADAILWHPVPFRDPSRLVHIRGYHPAQPNQITIASAALDAWSARPQIVSGIYFWSLEAVVIGSDDQPEAVTVARVSPGLIRELGVAIAGRDFSAADAGQRVAIISQQAARKRFARPRDALGRTINVDGDPYAIVGVAPAGFEFPTSRIAAWVPEASGPPPLRVRAIARIRADRTFARAAELTIASTGGSIEGRPQPALRLAPLTTTYPKAAQAVAAAVAASFALLLIGVLNASNLLLADTVRRTGELAVRRSLGATTGALVRQILIETFVRSAMAVAAALLIVRISIDALASGVPYILTYQSMRPIVVDWRAVGFAAVAAVVVACAASVTPCLRLARVDVQSALQNGAAAATPRAQARNALTVIQMVATVVLLAAAGLLVSGFVRLLRVDPGYDADGLTVVELFLPRWRYADPRATEVRLRALRDAVEAIPGVTVATIADGMPPRMSLMSEGDVETADGTPLADSNAPLNFAMVDGQFLSTLRIPLIAGGSFDDAVIVPGAVVSSSLATRLWPGRSAVGQRFRLSGTDPWLTVVGVSRDVMLGAFDDPLGTRAVFLNRAATADPPAQSGALRLYRNLVVRSRAPGAPLDREVRAAVARVIPGSPILAISSAREAIAAQYARVRFVTSAMTALAIVGLAISMLGVYGAFWCTVSERRREIGVRLAIGAEPRRIVAMVLADSVRLVVLALVMGVPLASATAILLKPMLFEVTPTDPITMTAVGTVLTISAITSAYLPARRAGATDPVETLRAQ